jgi:hypothetical protein
MQQQQASAVPKLVQRLRRSIKHKDTQQQQQLIWELVQMTERDPQIDANPVRLQVLQQTGICAALQQPLQMPKPRVPALAAQLISNLGLAGPQAAEQITAQPGITAARLLQLSSVRASRVAGDLDMAVRAIWHLSHSKVAAERLAAEPGVFAGLVGVLTATADEEAVHTAPTASFALLQTAAKISSSEVMRMLKQQPDAIAALSELLNSQHSHESQGQALRVLHAVVRAMSLNSAAVTAAATRVVQQLAGQRGMLPNLVRLLRSRLHDLQNAQQGNQEKEALCLLQYMVISAGAPVKDELLATPRAVAAIVRMLKTKTKPHAQLQRACCVACQQVGAGGRAVSCRAALAGSRVFLLCCAAS